MKAVAVNPGAREVQVVSHPDPHRGAPDEVEIEVLDVGICGTDREIASFQYGTPPDGSPYLIIGHECLGRVAAIGSASRGLKVGDLVVPMVRRPCNHEDCSACRGGRQDYCYTGDYTERGIKGRHGYMAERAVVHSRYLVPVPAALREVGVLVEPLTIAEKALEQVRAAQSRLPWTTRHRPANGLDHDTHHNAVVLGAGPVGLLGAMALRARQYRTWVYSREPGDSPRADLVRAIGAEYLSAGDVPIEALPNAVGQIDLVYEATGAAAAAFQALAVLGTNGIFVFTGVPGRKSPIEIETGVVMKRIVLENQVLLGTVNAGRESFESAVRDLAVFQVQWPEALRALITGRHPVDEAPALVRDGGGGIKEVVTFATGR